MLREDLAALDTACEQRAKVLTAHLQALEAREALQRTRAIERAKIRESKYRSRQQR